jgi:peptidyl-prolyl cis-trans isomerase C
MKFRLPVLSLLAISAFGQEVSAPAPDPATVLAVVDGRKITYGEVNAYFTGIGEEARRNALRNPKEMIRQYALFLRLQDYAKVEKLDQVSPYKESIEATRVMALAQAGLNEGSLKVLVTPDEQKKFYEENKERFTQVKVQGIYLAFVADPAAATKQNPGKTYRSQDQAKAKIEEIRGQVKTHDDFARLAKELSDDQSSRDKGGDFGSVHKSENMPADIKQTLFSLKTGEVSNPIQQSNGYWIFRIDETGVEGYDSVKDAIYTEMKTARAKVWIDGLRDKPVEFVAKDFFDHKSGATAPASDTVIAIVDAQKITYAQFLAFFTGIGDEARKNAIDNPKEMMQQYALSLRLDEYAKSESLEGKSPYKESLAATKSVVLVRAAMREGAQKVPPVSPAEEKKYYEENKANFTEVKVQTLYIGFSTDASKPGRTPDQAKAKIEEIRAQIKTREDFLRLVKEFSEDETSKANGGDFGTIRKADNVPIEIKQVIFSMKPGDISGAVAQKTGYYLFRVDSASAESFDSAKERIHAELQNAHAKAWIESLRDRPIETVDKAFFGEKPGAL